MGTADNFIVTATTLKKATRNHLFVSDFFATSDFSSNRYKIVQIKIVAMKSALEDVAVNLICV